MKSSNQHRKIWPTGTTLHSKDNLPMIDKKFMFCARQEKMKLSSNAKNSAFLNGGFSNGYKYIINYAELIKLK